MVAFCLGLSACTQKVNAPARPNEPQRYDIKGKVTKLEKERKRITVDHEKIAGFMEAMTMEFAVKDETTFGQLQIGNQITATLIYDSGDNRMWLENVKVVP